jgi:CTP:molybdopterin cytidylyltransferase MocA
MGFPKALLEFRGETFLDRLVRLFAAHCSPVVAVLGAEAERIRAGLRSAEAARLVVNPEWRGGQITSMQCGLREIAPGQDVLFTLVDVPAVTAQTLEKLLAAAPAPLRIPRFDGRRGHPVLFAASLVPEFLALGPAQSARDVVNRHPVEYVDTDDAGVVRDIDDPEAYRQLEGGARA